MVVETTRPGYKVTEIGEIPEEWEVEKLGNPKVSTVIMGQSPPSSSYNEQNKGLPFLQGNADFGAIYPKTSIYCTKPMKTATKADILISVRAPVGELNISPFECIIGRGLAAIRSVDKHTDGKYLYYYLRNNVKRLRALSAGSTFEAVGKNTMMNFGIALPSFTEQQKIAKILSGTDSLIESLDKLITKKKNIKQGLMQTLLTRGIGHTKFKKTEIGEIPEEWNLINLGNPEISINTKAGGTPLRSRREYYENGTIPFVKIEDIVKAGKYLHRTNEKVTEKGIKNSSSWIAPESSILFSMYASYGELSINIIPVAMNQAILSIELNKANVDLNYLYYYLKSLKPKLNMYLRSTTQSNLNGRIVRSLLIPIPHFSEQQKIGKTLSDVDNEIETLEQKRDKYKLLKTGMMQQLLTGGIRVR